MTCGLSRAAGPPPPPPNPPPPPPPGAKERDELGEGLCWEEKERLDSPAKSMVAGLILKDTVRDKRSVIALHIKTQQSPELQIKVQKINYFIKNSTGAATNDQFDIF